MTFRKLYSTLPKMKESYAKAVAGHILSTPQTTRKDLADTCNMSLMSATKAASILFDCGIISEKDRKNARTMRSCGHISLSLDNNFIIIDVSRSPYKMICIDAQMNTACEYLYKYQSIFSLSDNIRIFCERGYAHLSQSVKFYSGICVILPDECNQADEISHIIQSIFHHTPDCVITLYNAVCAIRRSCLNPHLPASSIFYLNISESASSYFSSEDFTVKCDVAKLISKNRKSVGQILGECINSSELTDTVFDIFNCASAMLNPSVFILESDRFILGSASASGFAQKLKATFDDKRKIIISDKRPHYYIKGGACELMRKLMIEIMTP